MHLGFVTTEEVASMVQRAAAVEKARPAYLSLTLLTHVLLQFDRLRQRFFAMDEVSLAHLRWMDFAYTKLLNSLQAIFSVSESGHHVALPKHVASRNNEIGFIHLKRFCHQDASDFTQIPQHEVRYRCFKTSLSI